MQGRVTSDQSGGNSRRSCTGRRVVPGATRHDCAKISAVDSSPVTRNTFLVADTHFCHEKMYATPFLTQDGTRLRPWDSDEEAIEEMVARWNSVVRPCDKVYHLGDVAIGRKGLQVLERLNGRKILIAGNHDWPWEKDLGKHFKSVRSYWKIEDVTLSHVPIHPGSLGKFRGNMHGHLHSRNVEHSPGTIDPRYLCVCVEQINFTPIEWSEALQRLDEQLERRLSEAHAARNPSTCSGSSHKIHA